MATNDPTLDKTLVMLDHTVEPGEQGELIGAEQLAEKLGLPFNPLDEFQVDPELFRAVPVEVMLRYQFLPLKSEGEILHVVMADPSNVFHVNELELSLARPLELAVGPASRIADILEKSESTQRVLDEATEGFRLQLVQDSEDGEEVLSIDRITADSSPIIRLVDSVLSPSTSGITPPSSVGSR
jgi:type IV pilus assembly protein PilB